jgi:cobalamin biosynthesis protein CobT
VFEDVAKKTKYMVYSKKYDHECRIGDLIDRETIERLNTHFDFHGYENSESVAAGTEWAGDIVAQDDLAVTILVELSGSMQGRPIAQISYGVLAATQALEGLGAKIEVLGYTTAATNRPNEEFETDRTIENPGRLSELLHVVVKDARAPSTQSPGAIIAMGANSPHLRHENIDGEAIIWATNRLLARDGQRKLLVLVADDFEPRCQASERYAKDRQFMKTHHKAVVEEVDASDELDFVQVIVGRSEYYLEKQDMYRAPVGADIEAGDVAKAIGVAVCKALVTEPRARATAAPTV